MSDSYQDEIDQTSEAHARGLYRSDSLTLLSRSSRLQQSSNKPDVDKPLQDMTSIVDIINFLQQSPTARRWTEEQLIEAASKQLTANGVKQKAEADLAQAAIWRSQHGWPEDALPKRVRKQLNELPKLDLGNWKTWSWNLLQTLICGSREAYELLCSETPPTLCHPDLDRTLYSEIYFLCKREGSKHIRHLLGYDISETPSGRELYQKLEKEFKRMDDVTKKIYPKAPYKEDICDYCPRCDFPFEYSRSGERCW